MNIEKVSETEVKITSTVETVVKLADLKEQQKQLETLIAREQAIVESRIAGMQKNLDKINEQITEAEKLGVVESVVQDK